MDIEEFQWAYCIARVETPENPIEFFQRVQHAKAHLQVLEKEYPDIPFMIYHRGDQLHLGDPAIHENVH